MASFAVTPVVIGTFQSSDEKIFFVENTCSTHAGIHTPHSGFFVFIIYEIKYVLVIFSINAYYRSSRVHFTNVVSSAQDKPIEFCKNHESNSDYKKNSYELINGAILFPKTH